MNRSFSAFGVLALVALFGCSSTSSGAGGAAGTSSAGGSDAAGGTTSAGGSTATGGSDAAGGTSSAGGASSTGGSGTGGTTASGCSIVGTFTSTTGTGSKATIVAMADGTFTLTIVTPGPTIMIAGTYTTSGDQITMTNTSASPSSVMGCIGEAATYALVWNADCSQVTFHKVSDTCAGRIGDADGTTLTRSPLALPARASVLG